MFTPIYYIITKRTSVKNPGFVYCSSRSWILKGIQQQYDVNLSFQHSCEISQENPDVSREFPGFPGKFSRVNFHQYSWEFPRILWIILKKFSGKILENSREFSLYLLILGILGILGNSQELSTSILTVITSQDLTQS